MREKAVSALLAVAILAAAAFGCRYLLMTSDQWQERHQTEGTQTCQQ